ncbi:hypothetical protein AB1Y20_001983 [Prymnesium parvum]|uniref:Dienelactone hydrolase domain-containing protein n=1 Tax=Prymnesium parvum TaxID=97485 RepID=A0AB34J7K9_PRYPA
MATSCCPEGSLPYLASDYSAKGTCVSAGAVDLYEAPVHGSPEHALILFSDIFGWNGSRLRSIADAFAMQGYLVVVPKMLTPALDGGCDGDALPAGGAFDAEWLKQFPWPVQQPKVEAALEYLKGKGAAKIGVVGFCYGGHPACWLSATHAEIVCGAVLHPSMQLEEKLFGGSTEALLKSVKCPFFLAPAGNDLPLWAESGPLGAALKASSRGDECVFTEYPEMKHGWSVRGDLADPAVARDVAAVLGEVSAFLSKHFSKM